MAQRLPSIATSPTNEPVDYDDEDYDAVDGGDVVHICYEIDWLDQFDKLHGQFILRKKMKGGEGNKGRMTYFQQQPA